MINSKLVTLLSNLQPKERKEIRTWLKSRAGGKDSFRLYLYLLKNLGHLKAKRKLEKERIHRALFAGKKYNDLKMRFMSFQLLKSCEDYIVFKTNTDNSIQYQLSLLVFYRKRGIQPLFDQTFERLQKKMKHSAMSDHDFFLARLQADREHNKYLRSKQNRTIEPQIQQISDDLDVFYLLNKLVISCEALNYKNIVKTDYNIRFIDALLPQVKNEDLKKHPNLRLRYLALMTLRDYQNEKYYHELRKNIDKYKKVISPEELADLYTLVRNYCIRKINLGNQEFSRELFDLYQKELELLHHSPNDELSPMIYKNITALAFKLDEYDWAYDFIKRYTSYLPEDYRDSYFNFNMARYYFIKKDFGKVIELLSHVEYNDFFIQLSAKALLLKTYFEMEEFSAFDSLAHSFRTLLKNKKGLGYHRTNYLHFIKYGEKLFSRKSISRKELNELRNEVKLTPEVFDREWLLEKLV